MANISTSWSRRGPVSTVVVVDLIRLPGPSSTESYHSCSPSTAPAAPPDVTYLPRWDAEALCQAEELRVPTTKSSSKSEANLETKPGTKPGTNLGTKLETKLELKSDETEDAPPLVLHSATDHVFYGGREVMQRIVALYEDIYFGWFDQLYRNPFQRPIATLPLFNVLVRHTSRTLPGDKPNNSHNANPSRNPTHLNNPTHHM